MLGIGVVCEGLAERQRQRGLDPRGEDDRKHEEEHRYHLI